MVRQLVKEDNRVIPIFFPDRTDRELPVWRCEILLSKYRKLQENVGFFFQFQEAGTDWSERTFGYSGDCAMYRKYDGKTCSGDYRYTGIDGGKSAYAE